MTGKTCALTGHRSLPENFDRNALCDRLEEHIGHGAAVECGDQGHRHILTQGGSAAAVIEIHTLQHVDQSDQRTNHTKSRRFRIQSIINPDTVLMS